MPTNFKNLSFILPLQLAAFWAIWGWYGRVLTADGESWSLLALASVVALCVWQAKQNRVSARLDDLHLILPLIFVALYAASFGLSAPPLVKAILAATALALTLSRLIFGRAVHLGLAALLFLSLPLAASLNFFAGFPLRVVAGEITAFLLRSNGLTVWREGVCLHFGGELIAIDAPCAGVRMLWFGLFLTAVLVTVFNLNFWRSAVAFAAAFAVILLGNVSRASALFYTETKIIEAPAWTHEAVGVFAFALVAAGIAAAVSGIKQFAVKTAPPDSRQKPAREQGRSSGNDELGTMNDERLTRILIKKKNSSPRSSFIVHRSYFRSALLLTRAPSPRLGWRLLAAVCALAAIAPLLAAGEPNLKTTATDFPGFPAEFEGIKLNQLELSEVETAFAADFPGKFGRFSDGRREIIFRFVTAPTRKLHPASDCFAALGYRTKPLPMLMDARKNRWSCFAATRKDVSLRVCERIYDARDESKNWTDVSAWYWSALSAGGGDWWAVTIAETMPPN